MWSSRASHISVQTPSRIPDEEIRRAEEARRSSTARLINAVHEGPEVRAQAERMRKMTEDNNWSILFARSMRNP